MIKTVLRQQVLSYTSYSSSIYLSELKNHVLGCCTLEPFKEHTKAAKPWHSPPSAMCQQLPAFFFYKRTFFLQSKMYISHNKKYSPSLLISSLLFSPCHLSPLTTLTLIHHLSAVPDQFFLSPPKHCRHHSALC